MTLSKIENISLSEAFKGRVVVVDTSSLLIAGTYLLEILDDCRFVIPAIVVKELEEKRTHPTLGFLAREWLRLIEQYRISDANTLKTGVLLQDYSQIILQIEPNHSNQKSLPEYLQDGSHDSTILAVANNLKLEGNNVVLLSNDMPMRLHSGLELDIEAFEYLSSELDTTPFLGRFTLDLKNEEVDEMGVYSEEMTRKLDKAVRASLPKDAASTSFTEILINGVPSKTAVLAFGDRLRKVSHKTKVMGVTGKTLEQDVLIELLKIPAETIPVVSIGGGAGTGKTLLTIATALEELKYHHYEKIVVFRSLHELGQGQEMGFLPGGIDEKMDPWAGAIYDAVDTLARVSKPLRKNSSVVDLEKQKAESEKLRGMLEIAPITYLRGRSLSNTFMILEEAQNFSRSEILNILSRAGEGTKIVLTWDAAQVDSRFLKSGKDADVWSVVNSLKHEDIFAHITLTKTERSRVAEAASRILETGK